MHVSQVTHTSRNLYNPLVFVLEGQDVAVYSNSRRLATIPARTLRCRRGHEAGRLAELFQTHSHVEEQAKQAANRAARQGFSYRNVYQGAVTSGFRSRRIPDAAINFMDSTVGLALSLEEAHL